MQAKPSPQVRLLAPRGVAAHRLARMLDSLVRVSRRVGAEGSASVPSEQVRRPAISRSLGASVAAVNRGYAKEQHRYLTTTTHADQRCALKAHQR